ncbi:hypothetical protein CI1B_37500 [Bradyrhizobium ivorense]|uniref:Uncharacterized protein n=1 Tax=Bradyrhizobium ivorense TaxID=2511166 RepID=A0A508T7Z5_9BRAD|nr:hypothetical protein CI1B_37500 [Bradyrhizobium ivorense]VIO75739.1 hypothetical protein CI41S_48930 [Bradyrhizobium ivorense]
MFSVVRILVVIAAAYAGSAVAEMQFEGPPSSLAVHADD